MRENQTDTGAFNRAVSDHQRYISQLTMLIGVNTGLLSFPHAHPAFNRK